MSNNKRESQMQDKGNESKTIPFEGGEGQGPDEETVLRRMLNTPPKPRTPKDWPQDDTPGDPNDPRCPSC